MFFKKSANVIFRNYDSFGYITDNRNFGYKKSTNDESLMGDKILSASGAVFFSALDIEPQALNDLANKINQNFNDVDIETIKEDAKKFYLILERDRFVISGNTPQECKENEPKFSYKNIDTQIISRSRNINSEEKSPQDFLERYYCDKHHLTNIHIEITSKCNERCVHCYIPHDNKTHDIDSSLFYDILKQCYDMKVLHLTLSGGEPMLHKNFLKFLEKCREYNFSLNILSNLTLLDDEIIKEMKKNPLLGVQVSLYAMNNEIHDGITQCKGSFEKTKSSILKLIENDIPLQISCPIMKQNKNCYSDVVKWAAKYNVHAGDDYVIIATYDNSKINLSCRLSTNEIREMISEKSARDATYLEKIEIESEKKEDFSPEDYVCSVCNSSICISDNGDVYPCAGWQGYVVGNIQDAALSYIWEESNKINYLRSLRKRDFPKCVQCTSREFCTMCMVRNANESPLGDPLEVNEYFCEIARFHKMKVLERKGKRGDKQ